MTTETTSDADNPKQAARLASQTRAIVQAISHCLATIDDDKPLDRVLAAYSRAHRELGSRDRRAIGAMCFASLRWWGWIEPFVPDIRETALSRTEALPDDDQAWPRLLLMLSGLERRELSPLVASWLDAVDLAETTFAAWTGLDDMCERYAAICAAMGLSGAVTTGLSALLPTWAAAALAPHVSVEQVAAWTVRRPPLWLRLMPDRQDTARDALDAAGLDARRHDRIATAVSVGQPRVNLAALPAYCDGSIENQDLASQCVGHICAPKPDEQWWDACCGGGGKALHLAALAGPHGRITATDQRDTVLKNLRSRAKRSSVHHIRTQACDITVRAPAFAFHGVLVDAPCSGSGRWRRAPDRMWVPARTSLEAHAARQRALLDAAAHHVLPGGVLVYATCSLFHAENEDVVEAFLGDHPAFAPDAFEHPLTGATTPGMLTIYPWDGDCNGMFIARLRRQPSAESS